MTTTREHGWVAMGWIVVCFSSLILSCPAAPRLLESRRYHLGTAGDPEWLEFEDRTPHGRRLEIAFDAATNLTEQTLFLWQANIKLDWTVQINGRKLGQLFTMEAPLIHTLAVPSGTLRDGSNTLSILPPKDRDDILVGEFQLDPRPLFACLAEATLEVRVTEAGHRSGLPCRITITDTNGTLAAISTGTNQPLATRPGVVYTPDGKATIHLRAGSYTVHASRGFEYSLDTRTVSVRSGQQSDVPLAIRREVPTDGLVACDPHVHTLTHSQHGDATLDERILTLAGEGIELPVATEHDQAVDYSEAIRRARLDRYLTPVVGDEVTTAAGHFNAFPMPASGRVPDPTVTDWPKLMASIRAVPGVQVVILNHPRDVHAGFRPFAETNFNAVSGDNLRGFEFTFDAVELINSGALRSDLMQVYRDWFALLNRGGRCVGVGASDSHDVSRFIVGQARTYIACEDDQVGNLNVTEACQNLRRGRAYVSMGLLPLITVNNRFGPGDLVTDLGSQLKVTVVVLGPSWAAADRVALFANGIQIREERLAPSSLVRKARITWTLPRPAHDVHLVTIASGPGVTSPHWAIPRPYQPSSRAWEPRVMGSSNPIWIDGDRDQQFTAARAYAQAILKQFGTDPATLIPRLATYDESVAAQAASLFHGRGQDIRSEGFQAALAGAPEAVQRGFASFAKTVPVLSND